ncbi:putative fun14 family protein [Diaporthe ampelina]|uniref:Putative fun14 family protein n=1 Tax=Diaporthe ampelina TaxID=1214573 RepID=A0A0G2FQE0_9PEZI|nr:putative fun14 family protein [Diaporthe ampelina]
MATATLCRGALRRSAAPLTLGLSTGLFLAHRQHQRHPMRLDALPASRPGSPATSRAVADSKDWLDPDVIRQLSGGSLAGFLTGLVVSIFSKTLVLLTGLAIVSVQVASQWGVDLLAVLKIRQRIDSSRVLSSLNRNPTFKLAFGTTFALAAFMHF